MCVRVSSSARALRFLRGLGSGGASACSKVFAASLPPAASSVRADLLFARGALGCSYARDRERLTAQCTGHRLWRHVDGATHAHREIQPGSTIRPLGAADA